MGRIRAAWLLPLVVCLSFAQSIFRKAPPDVEEALRARVSQFYAYFQEGKFRQAEALVAEQSRDMFYSAPKVRIQGFKVETIDFTADFQSAKVQVTCQMSQIGFGGGAMAVPLQGDWKLIDGQWYTVIERRRETPFGPVTPAAPSQAPSGASAVLGQNPFLTNPAEALASIQKGALRLESQSLAFRRDGPGSGTVVITNGMPGLLEVELEDPKWPGLKLSLSAKSIPPKGQATLRADYDPQAGKLSGARAITLRFLPVNRAETIQLRFE
jgi:hypothetical protein